MVALHHGPIGISLTSLHSFTSRVAEDLKHPILAIPVRQGAHFDALQGDDALGAGLCCVLEVVETPVVEDKPASLPILPATSLHRKCVSNKTSDRIFIDI